MPNRIPAFNTELPEGWDLKSVAEISTRVGSGVTPRGGSEVYKTEGILFIRSQNVTFSGLELSDVAFIDEQTHSRMLSSEVLPFDVLLNITGASIGRCCFAPEGLGTANQNQHVCTIRLESPSWADAKFFSAVLSSAIGQTQISRLNAGGNREGLNYGQLREFSVVSPPPREREQISFVLESIDQAIEQTEALIAKQQRIKTGLMQDLLTKGIDEHGNLRSEETHKFKDSEAGRIPVEWEPERLGNIASLQRGHDITEAQLRSGPFPVVSSGGVVGFHDVCTSSGPNVVVGRKGTIGSVRYLASSFWAHDTSLYVTNFWKNEARFVYYVFCFLELARYGTKSGSPSLNRNDVHPLVIGRPSPTEQRLIADRLLACDDTLTASRASHSKLQSLKAALMQDLLTGKKRVTPLLKGDA